MRRLSIATLAFLAVLTPLVSTLAQEAGPRVMPLEPVKDFDTVPKGELLTHVFEIRNEGNETLQILDAKPACGCTVAEFDKTVAPGKIGQIRVELDTVGFDGPINKQVTVFTNDSQTPKFLLTMKALVKPYLGMRPGYARFIYVQGENLQPITQLVWSEDNSDINITKITTPYKHIKVDYREATEEERNADYSGKQWVLDVNLDRYAPIGALRDYVEVQLDHPKQEKVLIPISGFVRPRQHVTPQKIDFGVLDGSSLPLQRVVTFTNFTTQGVSVTRTESGMKGLSVEVNEVGRRDGHRFELVLTMGPEAPRGDFEGTLKLHITDEQNPVVEVPIKGSIL